jgi:hypothetical protein
MSEKLGTLTRRLVHPTAPVLLTKNGPLGARVQVKVQLRNFHNIPIESLRIG